MATAAYRNPKPEVTLRPQLLTTEEFATFSALANDLKDLCDAGLVEAFEDPTGVIRYRPTERIA